jgi:Protein of unknown function (DUF2505)
MAPMKINVRHTLKTDTDTAFRLCTEKKNQDAVYEQLNCKDPEVKRSGRAPNVKLAITREVPAKPPAAIRRLVPATNIVRHTENWARQGDGYCADIAIDIRGVPVQIVGTKSLRPAKNGCTIEWAFDVTSGIPLLGSIISSFAGGEVEQNLEDEYKVLKKMC